MAEWIELWLWWGCGCQKWRINLAFVNLFVSLENQKEKTIGCNFFMAFVNPFVGVSVQIE